MPALRNHTIISGAEAAASLRGDNQPAHLQPSMYSTSDFNDIEADQGKGGPTLLSNLGISKPVRDGDLGAVACGLCVRRTAHITGASSIGLVVERKDGWL